MRVAPENYKGIEFIRISSLPEDQKKMIWTSLQRDKIIRILKNDCLFNDCIQAHDYDAWYSENYKAKAVSRELTPVNTYQKQEFKLAFK